MKHCETCKYWTYYTTVYYRASGKDRCSGCENPKIAEEGGQDYEDDALRYSYSEGGIFLTGPKFGCVHHFPL